MKYATATKCKVLGQHLSDNTVPHLTQRHFTSKLPPIENKSRPHVLHVRSARKRETLCASMTQMTSNSPWKVLMTIPPSSIYKAIRYNYSSFLQAYYVKNNYKAAWINTPIPYTFISPPRE